MVKLPVDRYMTGGVFTKKEGKELLSQIPPPSRPTIPIDFKIQMLNSPFDFGVINQRWTHRKCKSLMF